MKSNNAQPAEGSATIDNAAGEIYRLLSTLSPAQLLEALKMLDRLQKGGQTGKEEARYG